MKRLISLCTALVLFILLFPAQSSAADDVFVATNNMVLPMTDAMPIKSGGVWYVDYHCFTSGDLKVNSSYNGDSRTLVLYTWDTTLVFNLDKYTAYNTTDNIEHQQWSFSSRGTIYVPAQFTAQQLGITYSYIDSASVIRFRTSSNLNDQMFAYIAKNKIPDLIAQYNASKNPGADSSDTTDSDRKPPAVNPNGNTPSASDNDTDQEVTVQKRVYLTFDIRSGKNNTAILDALSQYGMAATFFVQGDTLAAQDDSIRRMAASRHAIGIAGYSGNVQIFTSPDKMLEELSQTNALLYQIAHMKTRLVRVPGGSSQMNTASADALVGAGYRYWDWTLDATLGRANSTASRISRNVVNSLNSRDYAVILLTDSNQTVDALPAILKYLSENNCIVSTLSVLDSPYNQRGDTR